jgi:hypothetical protein
MYKKLANLNKKGLSKNYTFHKNRRVKRFIFTVKTVIYFF